MILELVLAGIFFIGDHSDHNHDGNHDSHHHDEYIPRYDHEWTERYQIRENQEKILRELERQRQEERELDNYRLRQGEEGN